MSSQQKALLLVGSARRPRSTSESLGSYLLERLAEKGFETEMLLIHRALRSEEGREALLAAVDQADLLVLAAPLYVDCLPALAIKTLELIADHRQATGAPKTQRFLSILNCGFPEKFHNDLAVRICRRFAQETGFDWAGGLALGGGGTTNGQDLGELGGMVRNVVAALDLSADALAESKPVPQEAIALMAKPLIPAWMYVFMGGFGWRQQAKQHGVQDRLFDRPYQR